MATRPHRAEEGVLRPMPAWRATLWACAGAITLALLGYWLRGGVVNPADVVGVVVSFVGLRWVLRNGGITPGYRDPAKEQDHLHHDDRRGRRERWQRDGAD